jgi:hypothetical protein
MFQSPTTVPPFSMNVRICGNVVSTLTRPNCGRYFRRDVVRRGTATTPPTATTRARDSAANEHQDVVFRVEVPRVQFLREDARERELVLLEDPPRPAGIHRAAVLVPQPIRAGLRRTASFGRDRYAREAHT